MFVQKFCIPYGTWKFSVESLPRTFRVRSMNSVDFRRGWLFLFFYGFCIPWEKKSILHLTHHHKKKLEEKRKKKKETFINLRNLLIIGGLMATVKMSQVEQLMIFIQISVLIIHRRGSNATKTKKSKKLENPWDPWVFGRIERTLIIFLNSAWYRVRIITISNCSTTKVAR